MEFGRYGSPLMDMGSPCMSKTGRILITVARGQIRSHSLAQVRADAVSLLSMKVDRQAPQSGTALLQDSAVTRP